MNKPNQAQVDTANETLRSYAKQGAKFSCEHYQETQFIFRAQLPHGSTKFVIVGARGAVKAHGWS
jgi:predicted transcriptional regulator